MKNACLLHASIWIAAILCFSSHLCRAQSTDVGTAAQMPEQNGAKFEVKVSADNTYRWTLDGEDQGQITAAMGTKQVMMPAGRHEIVAKSADGKLKYDHFFKVAAGEVGVIRIVGKAITPVTPASPAKAPPPTQAPAPVTQQQPASLPGRQRVPPTLPSKQPGAAGNPDTFVGIRGSALKLSSVRTRSSSSSMTKAVRTGWDVIIDTSPRGGTHYDVKLQVVMKGVGDDLSNVQLPDPQNARAPHAYMTQAETLGKEAIVCYTARPAASQEVQRWTGTFNIQNTSREGYVNFEPAREPTLEPASDAPCGGLNVTKAAAPSPGPAAGVAAANLNHASSALRLGSFEYNQKHYPQALRHLTEACENDPSADACNSVGLIYQNHLGVATDYAKANEYYQRACNDDSSLGCSNLGTLYRDGFGVPRNYRQAVALFEKGCDAGVAQGCEMEGKMYMEPLGVPRDGKHALDLFKRACEMDSPSGCFNSAMAYQDGNGITHDTEKAKEYFNKACGLGDKESCGLARP